MTDTSRNWPDLAGRLIATTEGQQAHVLPLRVYFEDTDFSGVVYHATYLRWCERGRSDFLRLLGNDHQALLAGQDGAPAAFVVRRMNLDYRRPARNRRRARGHHAARGDVGCGPDAGAKRHMWCSKIVRGPRRNRVGVAGR